jgi:hypothetical protein
MDMVADLLDPPAPRDHSTHHVSDLINEAARVTGSAKWYPKEEPKDWQANIMALGRIIEPVLRAPVKPRVVDGVVGSPDGELVDDGPWSQLFPPPQKLERRGIVEFKSRNAEYSDPTQDWRYMRQCQAYCWMAGCTVVWMPIMYFPRKFPPNTYTMIHEIRYTPLELAENWQLLMSMKPGLEEKGEMVTVTGLVKEAGG